MPTIDPSKCWDTTLDGSSTIQRLDSGIADYQVHIRGGRIIPYQDAAALKVTKSADLVASPTQLIALTNAAAAPITLAPKSYTALAAGLIYLDDGSSATDIGRWDFEVIPNGNGQFTIDFHMVNDLKNRASAGKASTVESISFLWATETGFNLVQKAQVYEVSGAVIDLDVPSYDKNTDVLKVKL